MQVTKKLINDITRKLKTVILDTDKAKLKLAMDLYWAKYVINWHLTEYGGWVNFINEELTLHPSSVYRLTMAAEYIEKYEYSDAECLEIIENIGWTCFIYGLSNMTRRLTVRGFIKKYKKSSPTSAKGRSDRGDRAYAFSLPVELADKLDFFLLNHGMTVHETGRRGVREAMIRLVETKL